MHVDEGRKRVLLIAASILAARKLAQFEERNQETTTGYGNRPSGRRLTLKPLHISCVN